MPNIPGLDSIQWGGMLTSAVYWLGYVLLIILILAALFAVFTLLTYKYKVTIFRKGGGGDENAEHYITKIRKDRLKVITRKGITKWKFLLNRKNIPPVKYENIYPGNNIYLYQSADNTYHPFTLRVSNPSANFEAIPSDVSFWMGLEHQQISQNFTKQDFWSKYGNVAVMMGTVLFCLILVGVTVYYTYQHANGVTNALGSLTGSLQNVNNIAGLG